MKVLKTVTMLLSLSGASAMAEIHWQNFNERAVAQAQADGKSIILGFQKEGCGTCEAQAAALEKNGVETSDKVAAFRVERNDEKTAHVYENFGLNKKQWAALVLLKNGREFARVSPFQTSDSILQDFSKQVVN